MFRMIIVCTAFILCAITRRIETTNIENISEDQDDEDYFGVAREATYLQSDFYRKRRSDEEGFYHTLLSRSEPQHVFKRSSGTEDFAHNSAYVTQRDWTGSSKISDADRKELESLFSKLNADDSEIKSDSTRSLPEDEHPKSSVEKAATTYTEWLMHQPTNKIGPALSQKAHIDNRLTHLFFQKRGLERVLPNPHENSKKKKSIASRQNHRKELIASKLISQNSDAKHLIMAGPKLCNDDSPKCLCTRACYPNAAISFTPCSCEGKIKPKADLPLGDSVSSQINPVHTVAVANTIENMEEQRTHSNDKRQVIDPLARTWCRQACHPLNIMTDNPCKCSEIKMGKPLPSNPEISKDKTNSFAQTSATTSGKLATANAPLFPPRPPETKRSVILSKGVTSIKNDGSDLAASTRSKISNNHTKSESGVNSSSSDSSSTTSTEQTNESAALPISSQPASVTPTAQDAAKSESVPAANVNANRSSSEPAGLFDTKDPIYINHPSYQGCFKDRKPVRDLPKRFTRFDTTPEACISECKYQNYKFAGVQYGYLCFCGNAFGRYGKVADKDCNSFCNGDTKRKCGAFWHNSVYSVDGKSYDPNEFDFEKIDEEERLYDKLSPPPVKTIKRTYNKKEARAAIQGVNAANRLLEAAQAAFKAAEKLLPSANKKHKIGKNGSRRGKREDDEEDAEIMREKDNAMASLKAAHQIIQKTNFERSKRSSENRKRSISEDFDPYDPEDGKDLLKAYMSNVDAYKRQVRSVDDEEEEDDSNEKNNFQYRRMVVGELDEGQFVDRYDYAINNDNEVNEEDKMKKKRSVEKDDVLNESEETKKQKTSNEDNGVAVEKRGIEDEEAIKGTVIKNENDKAVPQTDSSLSTSEKKSNVVPTTKNAVKGDPAREIFSPEEKVKRSVEETTHSDGKQLVNLGAEKKSEEKRSAINGNNNEKEKKRRTLGRSIEKEEKYFHHVNVVKRNVAKQHVSKRHTSRGSKRKQKRNVTRESKRGERKRRFKRAHSSVEELVRSGSKTHAKTSGSRDVSRRDGAHKRRRRSLDEENSFEEKPLSKDYDQMKKRSTDNSEGSQGTIEKINYQDSVYGSNKEINLRQPRDLSASNLSVGALKMAARSGYIHSEGDSKSLESKKKKDEIITAENESESGSGDHGSGNEIVDDSKDGSLKDKSSEVKAEVSIPNAPSKRSAEPDTSSVDVALTKDTKSEATNSKLRSDVEKGVDSLLNLVVELYKQQKTIKAFESSVRSLRNDIVKELDLPEKDKISASGNVRKAIQAAAKERLHVLTSSIEQKITEFAKNHPGSLKRVQLAKSLLPAIPLNDEKLEESKREITRRSSEFDNLEDGFTESNKLPSILKEHFKRNAENDDFDLDDVKKHVRRSSENESETSEENTEKKGEKTLSRMHRDVSEAEDNGLDEGYDELF